MTHEHVSTRIAGPRSAKGGRRAAYPLRRYEGMSRRSLIRGMAAVPLALAGAAALPRQRMSAQELTPVTLALDWYPNANHAGIYMAQDRGSFEDAGLDVEIFTPADPTTVLQTVGAGRDTFGITYHHDVLQARSQEVPVVSIAALVQHPLNSLMVLEESDIMSPADLAGATIAVTGVPSDEALLDTMLRANGLSIDEVEVVNVGFDLMPAVMSGRADAAIGVYWTHETILAEREGSPMRYFRVEEHGVPDYYELVLVAGEETIANEVATVTAFLGALRQGYHDALADLDGALELLLAESPDLVEEVEREGLELLAPLWTGEDGEPFGTQTAERWEAYATWAIEEGLLPEDTDWEAAFRDDLFPEGGATPEASPVS
jgi:putative hydroxymethylpyrimidine transport system substrate-binding protein